ncbi:LytTR family DNA-binding domain-containing protein [Sporofaciens sp. JLR.KK001]|uniref:LytTR family DNA-binding domain-containing protein n=1 Tax=Sporofaciens sp. JLR.KK001 TaxID=3112621 RepID=UPI002FF0B993
MVKKTQINDKLNKTLSDFLDLYGTSGLENALQLYRNSHQEYICKTRTSVSKMSVWDIYYMEIREHQITIYTQHGTYHKYGTLNNELKSLSSYGFIKCAQNRIVSLGKIRSICSNDIILINGAKIHMSKKYAISIISEFSKTKKQF